MINCGRFSNSLTIISLYGLNKSGEKTYLCLPILLFYCLFSYLYSCQLDFLLKYSTLLSFFIQYVGKIVTGNNKILFNLSIVSWLYYVHKNHTFFIHDIYMWIIIFGNIKFSFISAENIQEILAVDSSTK